VPILLDIGANADCKPEHLVQFALMGREYATVTLGVQDPQVGLLNIGEEASKGSQLALEAHELMVQRVPGFFGNVEGRDIPAPPVDVIVTDGFTGNVAIKLVEGTAKTLMGEVAATITGSPVSKLAALALRGGLRDLKARLDPDRYGGAPLLGIAGVCIVGHGSSGEKAIASGIGVAANAARRDLPQRIAQAIA
jgi:glycerol-3-phosphate acyltransferase PlsX